MENQDKKENNQADINKAKLPAEEDYYDKYLRLQAEFDNFKKRVFKERIEFIKFANEGLILELVSILDDFERGIKAAEQKKDFALLHQGVDMISKQLHRLLEEKGLKKIKSTGEKFNPHEHEAIETAEDKTKQDNTIIEELQPGYYLNGRIIRPAKVKVIKNSQQSTDHSQQQ